MESGKPPCFTSLSESPPNSHGVGGDGITGGGAAGSGSGEVRGDRLNLSDQIAPRALCRLLPGEEKSADCHDGCVPKENLDRLFKRIRELADEFLGYWRDSCDVDCTRLEAAMTWKATKVLYTPRRIVFPDRSKGEQHELLNVPVSYHRGRKSGGWREPPDWFQEDCFSHSGVGKGGGRPYGEGYDDLGSSPQPFRGEAVARNSPKLRPREGDWRCSNFARRLRCGDSQGSLPEHRSRSRKGCSFPYASSSSYAGPSADCRAPPVPPSHAPRARDIRKRSRSPTRGALPPKDCGGGGDPKMKRGRDDRHGPA